MSELKEILSPVESHQHTGNIHLLKLHEHSDWEAASVFFISVGSDHSSFNVEVRKNLFNYFIHHDKGLALCDLGNLTVETSGLKECAGALKYVLEPLLKQGKTIIVLSEFDGVNQALYKTYEDLEQWVSYVDIDSKLDIGGGLDPSLNENYLEGIFTYQPNYLLNYCNLAYQSYFVPTQFKELMEGLRFETVRLGKVRGMVEESEPLIRNADLVSFDIGAIRYSEATAQSNVSPNGLYAEEACQIMKYAGYSDQLSMISVTGFQSSEFDVVTPVQIAQMYWSFLEGYLNRSNDYPKGSFADYTKFYVEVSDLAESLVFYQSNKSGRWWIKTPDALSGKFKNSLHQLIPCSYNDYLSAQKNQVPEKWWTSIFR